MKMRALLWLIGSALLISSCGDDDSGDVNLDPTLLAQWETEVTAARELADNSVEGTFPGDFFEGSIAKLREGIDLAQGIVDRATEDIRIESARLVLEFAIDEFEASLVEEAIPLFTGLSSEVLVNNPDINLSPNEFTVEFRVKLRSYDAGQIVADMVGTLHQPDGTLNTSGWAIRYLTAPSGNPGVVDFIIGTGNDGAFFVEPDVQGYTLPLEEWVHIAATFNDGNMKLYIDGTELLNFNAPRPLNADPAFSIFRIGNSRYKDGRYTNGNIIDVRFWDVERTEQEINDNLADYLAPPFSNYPDLRLYFPLNSNQGENIDDATGNYTATATGLTWVQE